MAGPGFTRSARIPPNRRRRLAALAAAGLAIALAAPAAAQVEVHSLTAPDLFSFGGASDLPSDVWAGSSGALYKAVVPQVGTKPMSPAVAALARRLIAAAAPGPQGVGSDPDVAGVRALAMLSLGDAADVEAITDRTPGLPQHPGLSQAAAEAALLRGEEDKACAIGDALTVGREGLYWLKLRAYCQARSGQAAAAQLTLDLAQRLLRMPDFERLMDALLKAKDGGAPALDNGLDYALSRRVSANWAQGLDAAPPAVAVAIARDPKTPPAARIAAAARAARLGMAAADAYSAVSPVPPDLAAADVPGPAGEAGLVALSQTASDWSLKERAVIAVLRRAKDGPEFLAMSRLTAPSIAQLVGAHAVLREPVLFAMAAAAAGDAPSARAARSLVGQGTPSPPAIDLALLDALIAAVSDPIPDSASARLQALQTQVDAIGRARAVAAIALLGALGAPTGPDARFAIAASDLGPSRIPPGSLLALDLGAKAGRMGDVGLYVVLMASESGVSGLSVADRAALIRALDRTRLKADARAFAVEGLLALQARP